jgi:hemoglobin-like flavoprotein
MQRMNGATEPILQAWFNAYKDIVTQFNIQEKDIYNMDETGFSIGICKGV